MTNLNGHSVQRCRSEIGARLIIADNSVDPNDVTRRLSIEPTKKWRAGEPTLPGRLIRHKENGWALDSGLSESEPLDVHVDALLHRLNPSWKELEELAKAHPIELSCVVRSFGGDRPPLGFDRHAVEMLARIRANIDIDLYIL